MPPALATYDDVVSYGSAPALDPTGARIAVLSYYAILVLDGAGPERRRHDAPRRVRLGPPLTLDRLGCNP